MPAAPLSVLDHSPLRDLNEAAALCQTVAGNSHGGLGLNGGGDVCAGKADGGRRGGGPTSQRTNEGKLQKERLHGRRSGQRWRVLVLNKGREDCLRLEEQDEVLETA